MQSSIRKCLPMGKWKNINANNVTRMKLIRKRFNYSGKTVVAKSKKIHFKFSVQVLGCTLGFSMWFRAVISKWFACFIRLSVDVPLMLLFHPSLGPEPPFLYLVFVHTLPCQSFAHRPLIKLNFHLGFCHFCCNKLVCMIANNFIFVYSFIVVLSLI